jgi:hypothetical protein
MWYLGFLLLAHGFRYHTAVDIRASTPLFYSKHKQYLHKFFFKNFFSN